MGRKIPIRNDMLVHPILSLCLFAVGFAATIAIITSLCVVRFLRRSSLPDSSKKAEKLDLAPPPPPTTTTETIMTPPTPQTVTTSTKTEDKTGDGHDHENDQNQPMKQLPLPPSMLQVREKNDPTIFMKKSASTRNLGSRLNASISMKFPRSLSMARSRNGAEKIHERKKGKTEDSIWMKTIILGEKCKVSEEEEEDEDAVVYDGKGNKISIYHPKTAMSMSRTNSCIDPSAVPKNVHNERRLTINGDDE